MVWRMKCHKIGIIGGGASGLMAAVSAARTCPDVVILEKKDRVGKKILATGNGKCNLTNLDFDREHPEQYYRGGNPERLASVFSRFSEKDAIKRFGEMGVLVTSRNGYIYPLSQQAAAVLDAFRFEAERLGVQTETECSVTKILPLRKGGFEVQTAGEAWRFERLILACGTPAGEKAGEGTDGYRFAAGLGHTVNGPWPALVQLICAGSFWKGLAGVRTDAQIRLFVEGKKGEKSWTERGELQLTDYGISGIPVFQFSRYASMGLARGARVRAVIDFLPDMEDELWDKIRDDRLQRMSGRTMEVVFGGMVNKKIIQTLWKFCDLKPQDVLDRTTEKKVRRMFEQMRNFEVTVCEAKPFTNAQVCAGGVPLREVTDEMESIFVPGLYLAGELLDVDGRCGGYNLQWAWSSGYLAGVSAAKLR